jgi:hypothetical protein
MICSNASTSFDLNPAPAKVSWENLEALKKVLPGCSIDIREDCGAFVIKTKAGVDLPEGWEAAAERAFLTADAAALAKKAAIKAAMEGWKAPVLPEPTALTKKLARQIGRYLKEAEKNIAEGDYGMAQCYASDAADLIVIMREVDAGHQATAYRLVDNLDTIVRDSIPEDVWNWLRAA